MNWLGQLLDALAYQPAVGYQATDQSAEPTALAAIALARNGRRQSASLAARWLANCQSPDGSVPIRLGQQEPRWPTSLAILSWIATDPDAFQPAIQRAINWTLGAHARKIDPHPSLGHDTTLDAWPWVLGTHGWIEPTAFHVLALKATGYDNHARCREAIRMLLDRQLSAGGCNYGNTSVLGQTLRPHLQPSGIALVALAGESGTDCRIQSSLKYLETVISHSTGTASLCWAIMGLEAHGSRPRHADLWLRKAAARLETGDGSPYKQALICLAATPHAMFPGKSNSSCGTDPVSHAIGAVSGTREQMAFTTNSQQT